MRVSWIDIVKGIGILLVVAGHSTAINLFGGYVGRWIGSFHMPLFFVMAGLCFDEKRYSGWFQYLKRKLTALGYPYVMLSVFLALLSVALYFGDDSTMGFWRQMRMMVELSPRISPFWFILVLFSVEIAYWAIAKLIRDEHWRLLVCLSAASVGAFVLPEGYSVMRPNTFLVSLGFFGVAHAVKPLLVRLPTRLSYLAGVGLGLLTAHALLILFVFKWEVGFHSCKLGSPLLFFVVSSTAICAVSVLSMVFDKVPWAGGGLAWLGRNSIILMAIHGHCGLFRASWAKIGFSGPLAFVVEYGLMVFLMWILAGPLSLFVKIPRKLVPRKQGASEK